MNRRAKIERITLETNICLDLKLDGTGSAQLHTGAPFLEHMLALWCRHGCFDLQLQASGDLEVEPHHLVEDVGICLGRAFTAALGSKENICRYGSSIVPMDESLVLAAVDLSGRPYLHYEMTLPPGLVGSFDPELLQEFWQAFVHEARLNLHFKLLHGRNKHHIVEASFKAAGRALSQAAAVRGDDDGALSTKGKLE